MPAPPPLTHALLSHPLPSRPYILDIIAAPGSAATEHLLLRHPSADISIADAQTLQLVGALSGGHVGNVSAISVDGEQGAVWSAAKDARVIRWDERARRVGMRIDAAIRRPLPLTALVTSESDHLVIAGTELQSSEAHILYYDTRNSKTPVYTHSSTHSDDITHLSLLPPTHTFLPSSSSSSSSAGGPLPTKLLLSGSTDGLVALTDMREADEDEALLCAENWGQSIASAGAFPHNPASSGSGGNGGRGLRIWARSDMDNLSTWRVSPAVPGPDADSDARIQLDEQLEHPSSSFRDRTFTLPRSVPLVPRQAAEERADKDASTRRADYLIDVLPSLGASGAGAPLVAVGNNAGDIVLQYEGKAGYEPAAYLLTGPEGRGHGDVVRAILHDWRNEAVYTGSEDGVLGGWSTAGWRLRTGDRGVDDDGGDGREAVGSDDEDDEQSEESEIRTESESEDGGMDVDGVQGTRRNEMDREPGPRYGPILGGARLGDRRDKRKEKRHQPY